MQRGLKYGLIGAGIGFLFLIIAFISDLFVSCNGITITEDGSCHSLLTQMIGSVFYYIDFPLIYFDLSILLRIGFGIIFLFVYGALLGLIVRQLNKK